MTHKGNRKGTGKKRVCLSDACFLANLVILLALTCTSSKDLLLRTIIQSAKLKERYKIHFNAEGEVQTFDGFFDYANSIADLKPNLFSSKPCVTADGSK